MRKLIITIGREFGSGGRVIGQKVAEKLGFAFYDKELIALAAKESNINENMIENLDETASSRFFYALPTASFMPSTVASGFDLTMNDRLFLVQSKTIKNLADAENAVIVGRCADYVLRNNDNVINVFIHAPFADRVKRAVDDYKINSINAEKTVKKRDEQRMKYYNYYAGRKWGVADNYTLCIDSTLGLDNAADIICLAAKAKMAEA